MSVIQWALCLCPPCCTFSFVNRVGCIKRRDIVLIGCMTLCNNYNFNQAVVSVCKCLSTFKILKKIIPSEFQSLFVCFLTKHRHGLCRGFRGAEACLSGKPLKITTWEILGSKQSLSHGKTLHEKQYSESSAASHTQKYALLIHHFLLHQSQDNPTLLRIQHYTIMS